MQTDDWVVLQDSSETKFLGYDELESNTKIVQYEKYPPKDGELYQLVLDQTHVTLKVVKLEIQQF